MTEFDMEAAINLADEFSDHLFDSTVEFFEKRGLKRVSCGVVLYGVVNLAGATLTALPDNLRPVATLNLMKDLLDATEEESSDEDGEDA